MDGDAAWRGRIRALHRRLGLPEDYIDACPLPPCPEPEELVPTEPDCFGRPQRLAPDALAAWTAMKRTARADRVGMHLVSAHRTPERQFELIREKLERGRSIEAILAVNAAPGFSEHHTGRAIDIGAPGCEPLTEAFEETEAFRWLAENARRFGFAMSYPRGNPFGIAYEPWHWRHHPAPGGEPLA